MNTLRSPITVAPPPPAVPRCTVTNSRNTLRLPIDSVVFSPLNFRSCGIRPIEANGNTSVPSPIVVQPSITAFAPTLHSGPSVTCGPITAFGPMVLPSPISAPS